MVVPTPRSIGLGTMTVFLVLSLVVGIMLGTLAPSDFRSAGNHESDHRLRGIATGINSDVRSAASTGEVSASHVPLCVDSEWS